MKWKIWW